MIALQDILSIENTQEILGFTCPDTDYLLWPRIRALVLRMVIDAKIYGTPTLLKLARRPPVRTIRRLKSLTEDMIHNLRFHLRQANIVFFSSGITNVKMGSAYFNRVSDHFASCFPDSTLLIEDTYPWRRLKPRANKNLLYHAPYAASAGISARSPFNRLNERPIREFVSFLRSRVEKISDVHLAEDQTELLHNTLAKFCRNLKRQLKIYEKLYRTLDPDLIFFEDGCYGHRAHMIRLAKEMGIRTAEMQHGLVSLGHDAYNFAPEILQSDEYRKYTPDYFLSYGQWWKERMNAPVEVLVIGNPHHETMKERYKQTLRPKAKILLLSNGLEFDHFIAMARVLKKNLQGPYEVLVRPHPLEKPSAVKKYGQNRDGIIIDDSENLYESLGESFAVIGDMSTALFEAIGLADKIFAISNKRTAFGMPDCPFERFDGIEDLPPKLASYSGNQISHHIEALIWQREWKKNYSEFIRQRMGLDL